MSLLPEPRLELVLIGPDGTRQPGRWVEGNSWLKQAAQIFAAHFGNTVANGVCEWIGGASVNNIGPGGSSFRSMMATPQVLNNANIGVAVGSSGNAVNRDNCQFGAKIGGGTNPGQLVYQDTALPTDLAPISGGYRITIEREFLNDSGGDITVREAGLAAISNRTDSTANFFLLIRDLTGDIAVVNGGGLIVRYHLDWLV